MTMMGVNTGRVGSAVRAALKPARTPQVSP
jgi:hypothetical protein